MFLHITLVVVLMRRQPQWMVCVRVLLGSVIRYLQVFAVMQLQPVTMVIVFYRSSLLTAMEQFGNNVVFWVIQSTS